MSPSRTRALRDAMRYRAREADAWLPKMRAAYKRVIERQWEEAIEAISGGEGPAVALARLHDSWVKRAYEDTIELVAVGTVAGYKLTEKVEMGITGKAAPPLAPAFEDPQMLAALMKPRISEWVLSVSDSISATTAKRIDRITKAGLSVGETGVEIADRLLLNSVVDTHMRATLNARTVTIWAYNEGARQRYADSGVQRMEWLLTIDELTCERCIAMAEKTAAIDEGFREGDRTVDHPPLHPRCRCAIVPVLDEQPTRQRTPTSTAARKPRQAPKPKPPKPEPSGFVPAKTTTEARKAIAAHAAGGVGLSGLDLETLNQVSKGFGSTLGKYGVRLEETVDFSRGRMRAIARTYSRPGRAVNIEFQKTAAKDWRKTKARAADGFKFNHDRRIKGLKGFLADPTVGATRKASFRKSLAEARVTKRWIWFDNYENIAAHEAGHAVMAKRNIEFPWLAALRKRGVTKLDRLAVSEYAYTSSDELFSEVLSAVSTGHAGELPKNVLAAFREVMGEK